MLNRGRRMRATHIDSYWSARRLGRGADPPVGLDAETVRLIDQLDTRLGAADAPASFLERLWHELETVPETDTTSTNTSRAWSGPALDPNRQRRPARAVNETEEQQIMADSIQSATPEPIPIQQRRWFRETLKLVAAAIIFIAVGAFLALALRGDDDQTPAIGPSGPTPTPTVEATATPVAIVPAPTEPVVTATTEATATAAASPTPSLPSFGTIAATILVGEGPRHMAAGEGALWVTNAVDGTVSRIDLETNEVVATIQVATAGEPAADGIAVGGGSVWVTAGGSIQIVRIDPATNQVVATIPLNVGVHELEFGGGALWGKATFSSQIIRVDPATNTVVASIPVPPPASLVYAGDALWVQDATNLSKIDPATNTIVATVPYTDLDIETGRMLRSGGGKLWTIVSSVAELTEVDPTTDAVVSRSTFPDELDDVYIAASDDALWICPCFGDPGNEIWQLDLATREWVAVMNVPDVVWIEYEAGALWGYTNYNEIVRIDLTD